MSRLGLLSCVLLASVSVSCLPGRFDDLSDNAWFKTVDRDKSKTAGTFGGHVTPVPAASGQGAQLVISASNPCGLALVTLGNNGSQTGLVGFTATGAAGPLAPLTGTAAPTSMAAYGANQLVVGSESSKQVVRYDLSAEGGFSGGVNLVADSPPNAIGRSVVVGDLGLGGDAADVAAIGDTKLVLIPDADVTATRITCTLTGLSYMILADVDDDGRDDLIIGGLFGGVSQVRVIDPSTVVDGQACPGDGSPYLLRQSEAPYTIAAGHLDSNPGLDIVAGTKDMGATVFLRDETSTTSPRIQEIGKPASETTLVVNFGKQVAIGNIDNDAQDELIIGDDSATSTGNAALAGRVYIYKLADLSDPMFEPTQKLFNPDASAGEHFGQTLSILPFTGAGGAKNILGIGAKDKVYLYFRTMADATDPR